MRIPMKAYSALNSPDVEEAAGVDVKVNKEHVIKN